VTDFLAIHPARGVRGTVRAPSSKSATNRALLLAALSAAPIEIVRPLDSEDTRALSLCLAAMGASIERTEAGLLVSGPLSGRGEEEILLDTGDSGTAARFLTAVAAATPGRFLLTGSERLRERPVGELVEALRAAGAEILFRGREGCLPLAIRGGTLRSGSLTVDASRSSQFLSALLLAAVAVPGGLEVVSKGRVVSAPYVGQTLEALEAFGHDVTRGDRIRVARGKTARSRFEVPGDYSSAVPLLAAAGIAGGEVRVAGVSWPSSDADAGALPVLERMGLEIECVPGAVTARSPARALAPVEVAATDFPDSVPALAALAAFAPGQSRFLGVGHLRLKESDRIAALEMLLSAAGAVCLASESGLLVEGAARGPGVSTVKRLPTLGDHRVAMAAGLLSLRVPGCLVENPGCVAKSYPAFFSDLTNLALFEPIYDPPHP